MSSFLCFLCHSTVNSDTNEDTREKYREVVGMNLCPDSHLCHICCHVLNKLWLFKTVCLKRSLEYPVLFSEKGTINLQRNDLELQTVCPEYQCGPYHHRNINSKFYHFQYSCNYDIQFDNEYVDLQDEQTDIENYFNVNKKIDNQEVLITNFNQKEFTTETKHTQTEKEVVYQNRDVQTDFDNDLISDNDSLNNSFNDINNEIIDNEVNDNLTNQTKEEIIPVNDDINLSENLIEDVIEEVKVKKRSKKKKDFEKIILTLKEQKEDLEVKRKSPKYLEAVFKCYNCALGFLFKDTYQTHMMRHEESNGEYFCSICTLRFASPAVLRSHTPLHSERYRCTKCGETLRRRAKTTHGCYRSDTGTSCHLCARMFKDISGLQQHLRRFHKSKNSYRTYSCNVCGKQYNNQAAVRTHMIKHINQTFQCDVCSSKFSSPYTLNRHKLTHATSNEQYYCATCNIAYSSEKGLKAHLKNAKVHQTTVFECPVCARACPTQSSLNLHISAAHCPRSHLCPHCPARFATRKSLTRHINRHLGTVRQPKKAICHNCGGTFKGNNKLNRHLREVCEKAKLEEEFTNIYDQECLNNG